MPRKKRTLAIIAVLLVLLIGLPCWLVYRQIEQARKDQALIAAIKELNTPKALELLSEGADGNAYEAGETPSFWQMLRRFLHPRSSPADNAHVTALALLYQQNLQKATTHYTVSGLKVLRLGPGPDLTLVRALLDHHARVNERAEGGSPFMCACHYSDADTVRLMLERGADANATGTYGGTPLMLACAAAGVTRVLLEHGAETEMANSVGMTALIYAVMLKTKPNPDVVRLLLEHGANVSARGPGNHKAIDYVKGRSDPESRQVAALLRKYGAK